MAIQDMAQVRGRSAAAAILLPPELVFSAAIVGVAALYYLVGPTLLSLPLLALLAYLCGRRSDLAVPLIPLAVPFYLLPKHLHLIRNLDFSLGETVILLCAAAVLLQQARTLRDRPAGATVLRHLLPASPFELPALGFLLAATLATAAAHFHTVALREYREVVLEPLLFYWLVLQRVRGPVGAARLVLAVAGAGTLVAAMGLIQIVFRPQDLAVAQYVGGAPLHLVRAVYGNENNLALLLDRAIPMALALALLPGWLVVWLPAAGRRATEGARLALVLCAALMGGILYATNSRGGELALAVCLALLFLLWQWRRPALLGVATVAVALGAFVARHRLTATFTGGHGLTNDARLSVWGSALRMIRDHPLFGVGPDNFLYYYSDDAGCAPGHIAGYYYVQAGKNFERCLSHPHNLFLDLWLSTGILGLLTGLALLVLFAVLGVRAWRAAAPAWQGPLLAVLLAALALVVHGQVDNSLFLPDLAVFFWLGLGVVAIWQPEAAASGIGTSAASAGGAG